MVSKCFVLAFVALFALQATEAKSYPLEEQRGLIEDLGAVIEKLKEVIGNAIGNGISAVQKLLENLKALAKELVEKAKDKIKEKISQLLDTIQKLKDEAEKLGVDVTECVGDSKADVEKAVEKAVEAINKCVSEQISLATEVVQQVGEDIRDLAEHLHQLQLEAAQCTKVTCFLGVVVKAKDLVLTVPSKVNEWVKEATELVVEIENKLPRCIATEVKNLYDNVQPIVDTVNKCIADKISQH